MLCVRGRQDKGSIEIGHLMQNFDDRCPILTVQRPDRGAIKSLFSQLPAESLSKQPKMDIRFSGLSKWLIGDRDLPFVQRDVSLDGDGKIGDFHV